MKTCVAKKLISSSPNSLAKPPTSLNSSKTEGALYSEVVLPLFLEEGMIMDSLLMKGDKKKKQ